jgi:molybdate transport system substrate-binding protein
MKRILYAATFAALAVLPAVMTASRAADIAVLASTGTQAPGVALVPQFEKETGHKLNITWAASNLLIKQAQAGEAFDAIIVTPALIKSLIEQDGSAVDLTRAGLGVGVKQSAPKLAAVPGIEVVGPFPAELQSYIKVKGMEPG